MMSKDWKKNSIPKIETLLSNYAFQYELLILLFFLNGSRDRFCEAAAAFF
jgi:hypothetical protein